MVPEVASYLEFLNKKRAEVWKNLDGVSAEGLNWTPLPQDTNSLLVLATHALGAEHGWIAETVGREPQTRVRSQEFLARGDNVNALRERYEATARETERILAGLSEQDLASTRVDRGGETVTVRWAIEHVIEHYAEHIGQMKLTRQLWEQRG